MRSKARFLGHPVHQMLIVFPLGLLLGGVAFDLVYAVSDNPGFAHIGFWNIGAGIVTGLIAAVFGFIDWRAIPQGTRARRIGAMHGLGNVLVIVLFAIAWAMRRDDPAQITPLIAILQALAVATGGLTAWLGGELVDRLGVGVDEDAGLDASNSLRAPSSPARARAG